MPRYVSIIVVLFSLIPGAFAQQKQLNPDISLNGLFHYQVGSKGNVPNSDFKNGFDLKELELRMAANLDAYFRADARLGVHKEPPATPGGEEEWHVEPEEAFIETLQVPGATVKFGKYLLPFGKHNQLHAHQYYFIDAPYTTEGIFGDHGWSDEALGVSYLAPTPWFFELSVNATAGENEHVFGTGTNDDVAGMYSVKQLWDLSDSSTFEWIFSYGHGRDQQYEFNHVYNSALTYKWRPTEDSKETSLAWTLEGTSAQNTFDENGTAQGRTQAISTWVMYQFDQRWWAQLRHEQLDYTDNNQDAKVKNSALIAYVPTEYSAIRLQYDTIDDPTETEVEQRGTLQFNFSMGAHPAHAY